MNAVIAVVVVVVLVLSLAAHLFIRHWLRKGFRQRMEHLKEAG